MNSGTLFLQELQEQVEAKGSLPHANKVLILDFDHVLACRPRKRSLYPSHLISGDLTKAALKQLNDEGISLCIAMKKTKDEAEQAFNNLKDSGLCDYFQFVVYDDRFVPDRKHEVLTANSITTFLMARGGTVRPSCRQIKRRRAERSEPLSEGRSGGSADSQNPPYFYIIYSKVKKLLNRTTQHPSGFLMLS